MLQMLREKRTLLDVNTLLCPRCKQKHSVEEYLRLKETEEFKSETVPIYKCPSCKWIFALAVYLPQDLIVEFAEFLETRAK